MIRTIIIDDEPMNIKLITGMIADHCPGLAVVGTTDDLTEMLSLVENLKPSLLLLDIGFPSGTIFPILEKLSFKNFQIIFITAHNTYAAEAFKQDAADYLLKPITTEALVQAVKRAEARLYSDAATDISKLLETLKPGWAHSGRIQLPSPGGILFINEADIMHCEAKGRYTILHMDGKKKLTITKTLKEIEALLNPRTFFRIHHSHIINLAMIKKYHRRQGGIAELNDGSLVEVSSSRKDEFLAVLFNKDGH
jgi:two-component system, LytTR family, response regulator